MSAEDVAAARAMLLRRDTQAWMRRRGRAVQPDLPPAVRRQFQEAFSLLDADGSGTLSEAEVFQGFKALNLPTSRAAVRHMVKAMTDTSSGVKGVTYAGFERLMAARREELPRSGAARAEVPLEVMARSLRRAKLLDSVLQEREAAIADYRARAAAAAAAREAEEHTAAAHDGAPDEALLEADDDAMPAPPPGLRDDDEPRPAPPAEGDEGPPAFAVPRRPRRRRSVLFCVGEMQKLVEL